MSANRIDVMLELERRGALPNDKAAILGELRRRGVVDESGFSFGKMASNIPSSGKQFISDTLQPIVSPVETAKSVGGLASGVLDKMAEKLQGAVPEGARVAINKVNNWLADQGVPLTRLPEDGSVALFDDSHIADAMGEFIGSRYGDIESLKRTAQEDPVGVLADLSMVVTLGGTAASRVPGLTGKIGAGIEGAGKAADPINLAVSTGRVAARGAGKLIPESVPQKLYQSAAKFSTKIPAAKRALMTETALRYGIEPTSKGVDKLGGIIGEIDGEINRLIDEATASGKTIPKKAVFTHLGELRSRLGGPKLEAARDLRKVDRLAKEFDLHMKSLGRDTITPTELQKFKQDAYSRIDFTKPKKLATNEARKAMARAAKEALEGVAPVKDKNRELGRLIDIKQPIEAAAKRIENRNVVGLGVPLNIGSGAVIGDATDAGRAAGVAAGTIASILEQPKIKAKVAIALNNLREAGLEGAFDQSLMRTLVQQGLFQSGRLDDATNQ